MHNTGYFDLYHKENTIVIYTHNKITCVLVGVTLWCVQNILYYAAKAIRQAHKLRIKLATVAKFIRIFTVLTWSLHEKLSLLVFKTF